MLQNNKILHDIVILTLGWLATSVVFFAYVYLSKGKIENVYLAWDGPSYVIAGLSRYVPATAAELNTIRSVAITPQATFLPAHFPLYPTLIQVFSFIGPYRAMIVLALFSHLTFALSIYYFTKTLSLKNPLLLSFFVLLAPPRYFVVSHTGSSEPFFLTFFTLSLATYKQKRFLASAGWAALAMATRPQGALIGVGYASLALYDYLQSRNMHLVIKKYIYYLSIPISFLLVCLYYQRQTGDFWAFFSSISIFHHFSPTLFPSFHFGAPNIETFWHEGNVIYYIFYAYSISKLVTTKNYQLAIFATIFYIPLLFLQHSDISRYSLTLLPTAIVAFNDLISRKDFIGTLILLFPATIMYGSDFIQFNRAP